MRFAQATSTHLLIFGLLATSLSPLALGDDANRQMQVEAASSQAYDGLRRELFAIPLGSGVTLQTVIGCYGAKDDFDALLHTSQQLGGTRWADDQTVVVRLELSGDDVAKFLQSLAARDEKKLPMPAKEFRERYRRELLHHSFTATGASVAACGAARLRPDPAQAAWRAIDDKDRIATIDAARNAAIERVLQSLQPIALGEHRLADAMAVTAVQQHLYEWMAGRPITSIEFHDDLSVQISLSASPADLFAELHVILEKDAPALVPAGPREWDRLHRGLELQMARATGSALSQNAAVPMPVLIVIPLQPPAWARGGAIEADGVSTSVGSSKLRTARAAENNAAARLREKLGALPLTPTMTLDQAARKDARIESALQRAVDAKRIAKVEYDTPVPGAARAIVTVDVQALWRELGGK